MKAKVVIIGGGCIGGSCLYHLAKKGLTDVILVEKDSYGNGSTGKSAGIVETQYTNEDDIAQRVRSMQLFKKFHDEGKIPLVVNGYMRIGRDDSDTETFKKSVEIQNKYGIDAKVLSPQQIKEIVPEFDVSDVKSAMFGPKDAYLDPYLLANTLVGEAKALGATALQNTEVLDIKIENGEVRSVLTSKGEIECEYIINAAGGWADKVGSMIGVDLPVKAYRRQLAVMKAPDIDYMVPSVMDYVPGKESFGVYFRDERGGKIVSGLHMQAFGKDEKPVDPDNYKQSLDTDYIENLAEKLLESAPGFSKVELQNGWSGVYPITPDNNPIVGELNEIKGFYNCIGFGGFGVQISPVFGEAMAELILEGTTNLINLEKYGLDRFKSSQTTN